MAAVLFQHSNYLGFDVYCAEAASTLSVLTQIVERQEEFNMQALLHSTMTPTMAAHFVRINERLSELQAKRQPAFIGAAGEIFLITLVRYLNQNDTAAAQTSSSAAPTTTTTRICFDLVGGFGKTFCIKNLCEKLFERKVYLAAPTARAALLYQDTNTVAKTINKLFRISPSATAPTVMRGGFRRHPTSASIMANTPRLDHYVHNVFIFDEFSMIPKAMLAAIIDFLAPRSTLQLFFGDSAQLLPVSPPIPYNFSTPMFLNVRIAPKLMLRENELSIPRFDLSAGTPPELARALKRLVLDLKHLIDDFSGKNGGTVKKKKPTTAAAAPQTIKFTKASMFHAELSAMFEFWTDRFSIFSFMADAEQPTQTAGDDDDAATSNILERMVASQRANTLRIQQARMNEIQRPCVSVGAKNSYNYKLQCQVNERLGKTAVPTIHVPSVLVSLESLSKYSMTRLKTMLNSLTSNLTNFPVRVCTGTPLICRNNHAKFYNGQQAVVLGIGGGAATSFPLPQSQQEEAENFLAFRALAKGDSTLERFADAIRGNVRIVRTDRELEKVSSEISLDVWDLDSCSKKRTVMFPLPYCESCKYGGEPCAHHTLSSAKETIRVFFWHPNYAVSVFGLQGLTLNNDLVCNSREVFGPHILRSVYVIVSRVTDPRKLFIDKTFVLQFIRAAMGFRGPLEAFKKFAAKFSLFFPAALPSSTTTTSVPR